MGEGREEQHTKNTGDGSKKGKGMLGLGILFVVAAVIAIVIPVVLLNTGDDPTDAPVPSSTTPSPTVTSIFSPNSPEACAAISQGGAVPDQDAMIWKSFNLTMDVSLTSDLYDYDKVVGELQSRMQQTLGPKLADCPDSRRLRSMDGMHDVNRKLLAQHIIGNVLFDSRIDSTSSCKDEAPSPCIVVSTSMFLYLKDDQNRLPLIQRISNIFEESEVKSDPFALVTITDQQEVIAPSPSPTRSSIYDSNSAESCEIISSGGTVPNQENMLLKTFDVVFDVSLTLQLSDLSNVVAEMASRVQFTLAPQIAQCQWDPLSLGADMEWQVIGNAQFFFDIIDPTKSCDRLAPTPCFRATAKLNLFLKGEEQDIALANHISSILGGQELTVALQLTAPFNVIQVVGFTRSADPFVPEPPENFSGSL